MMTTPFLDRSFSSISAGLILIIPLLGSPLAKWSSPSYYWVFLILLELLFYFAGFSNTEIGYIYYVVKFYACYFLYALVEKSLDVVHKKTLLYVALLSTSVTLVNNIILRDLLGDTYYAVQDDPALANYNIAETYYVTGVMFLSSAVFYLLQFRKQLSLPSRFVLVLVFVLSLYFLFAVAARMTVIILLSAMLFLIWLFAKPRTNKLKIIVFLIIATLLVLQITGALIPLIKWLVSLLGNEGIDARLESILFVLQGEGEVEESGTSLSGRYLLTMNSIGTWLTEGFFFGVGDLRLDENKIGNHSYLFDSLARFGLFYVIICFAFFYKYYKSLCKAATNQREKRIVIIVLVFFLLRNIIGASFYAPVGVALFIIYPIVLELSHIKEIKKKWL